jgi:hypothetical protein
MRAVRRNLINDLRLPVSAEWALCFGTPGVAIAAIAFGLALDWGAGGRYGLVRTEIMGCDHMFVSELTLPRFHRRPSSHLAREPLFSPDFAMSIAIVRCNPTVSVEAQECFACPSRILSEKRCTEVAFYQVDPPRCLVPGVELCFGLSAVP